MRPFLHKDIGNDQQMLKSSLLGDCLYWQWVYLMEAWCFCEFWATCRKWWFLVYILQDHCSVVWDLFWDLYSTWGLATVVWQLLFLFVFNLIETPVLYHFSRWWWMCQTRVFQWLFFVPLLDCMSWRFQLAQVPNKILTIFMKASRQPLWTFSRTHVLLFF